MGCFLAIFILENKDVKMSRQTVAIMFKALLKQLQSLPVTTRGGCVYYSHDTNEGKPLPTQETRAFKSPEFGTYVQTLKSQMVTLISSFILRTFLVKELNV